MKNAKRRLMRLMLEKFKYMDTYKKYIGCWAILKDFDLYRTNNPPIDPYIFFIVGVRKIKNRKMAIVSIYNDMETIFEVPFKNLILNPNS